MVKAICDWADGTKDKEWQPFAGVVAASLVKHVLTKTYIPEGKKRKSGMCNYVVRSKTSCAFCCCCYFRSIPVSKDGKISNRMY